MSVRFASRTAGSAPTLAAILVVVLLLCGFSVATTVYLDQQANTGLRAELASRAGADLALRALINRAPDAERQDAAVRAAIDRTFAGTDVTFDVTRTIESGGRYETTDPDSPQTGSATTATIPDLESRADFDAGTVADQPDEVAVQSVAAAALGLGVGDEVLLNDVAFTVSGTWIANDPLDPRWYGDDTVTNGGVATSVGVETLGPFVITDDAWSAFDTIPTAVWTIVPRSLDEFTAENRGLVTKAWATVRQDWRGEVAESDSLVAQGRLARSLDEFGGRIAGLRAIEPVAGVLVAGSALVVLSQLVQLLVASREDETRLLWSRGQSPASLARRASAEVAVVTLLGAALGVGAVAAWLAISSRVGDLVEVRAAAVIVPGLVVVAAVGLAAVASFRSVLSVTTATKGGRGNGRARKAAVPGLVILVAIAAAVSVWQLRLYGSPLTANAEGTTSIDPIAVAAPAAALVAVVLAALAAFPAIVALYARRTRNAGVPAHLSARTLALHTGRVTAPLVVVALAVGSATVGASFSATWAHLFDQTAALHAGSDLRISSPFDPLTPSEVDAVASAEGVALAATLDEQVLSVGTVSGTVLSATPEAVRQLATTASDAIDVERVAAAIDAEQPGPTIPDGATDLTLRVAAVNFVEQPALSAWIEDSLGRLREVPFDAPVAEADGIRAYSGDLAGLSGELVSLDLDLSGGDADEIVEADDLAAQQSAPDPSFRLESLSATIDGSEQSLELDQFWQVDTLQGQFGPPRLNAAGDGFVLTSPLPFLRMTPTFDGRANDNIHPGVVVTEYIADLLELEVGDTVIFSLRDVVEPVNSLVADIVPAIPGTNSDSAVLLDLSVINHFHQRATSQQLTVSGLWVKGEAGAQPLDTIRPILPPGVRIIASDDPVGRQVLGAASTALWAAAICCLLIALVAAASASSSRLRWGRGDIASLRAVGASVRQQSAAVVREMALVMGVAAVAGLLAGTLVSLLTVPELARAAVDRAFLSLGADLSVDWLGFGVLVGALAIGITAIVFALSRRVRSLASTSLPSEGRE